MILHEEIAAFERMGGSLPEVPDHVRDNLAPGLELRPYQEQANRRLVHQMSRERTGPAHLLFHMATGSGKTVIMAAAMLHLWSQGFRDFLFFVNSSQIVEKTKANFIDAASAKYLFAPTIRIGEETVPVCAVSNFDDAAPDAINIVFTTIQGLHTVLNNPKENGVTFEDFEDRPVVMISDEAHHINALTKSKLSKTEDEETRSWEHTVRRLLNWDPRNVLLEFSATVDMAHPDIATKYADKMIMDYPLRAFRADGYSKDIELRKADVSVSDRMLKLSVPGETLKSWAQSDVPATSTINLDSEEWHVFDDCYGTAEEKEFVVFIAEMQEHIREYFEEFYLVRNEKMIKLYEFDDDRATEPDYILLMRRKGGGAPLCRQVFIEPKGDRGWESEAWKSRFLDSIAWDAEHGDDLAATEPHEIRGLPFFGAEPSRRLAFKSAFEERLAVEAPDS